MNGMIRDVIGARAARLGVAAICALLGATSTVNASPIFDGINRNATPAFANNTYVHWGVRDVGWYYTPSTSFDLDGIYGRFLALGIAAPSSPVDKLITVQIRTGRPLNGGSVLREGTFTANLAAGGDLGATFSPLRLTAGTSYFIDFLDVKDVGISVATWANDINGNPQPGGGATTNLGAYYVNIDPGTTFSTVGGAYGQSAGLNIAGASPILLFAGTAVPEPSTAALLLGCAVLGLRRCRVV